MQSDTKDIFLRLAQSALEKPPKALIGITPEDLNKLVACFSSSIETGADIHRSPELRQMRLTGSMGAKEAMHCLHAWVASKMSLESWAKSSKLIDIKVEILTMSDCPLSKVFEGIIYSIEDCPEIPIAGCRRKYGCACCYTVRI